MDNMRYFLLRNALHDMVGICVLKIKHGDYASLPMEEITKDDFAEKLKALTQ